MESEKPLEIAALEPESATLLAHTIDPVSYRETHDCVAKLQLESGEQRRLHYTIMRRFLPGKLGSGGVLTSAVGCVVAVGHNSCQWKPAYGTTLQAQYAYPRPARDE
ncbi:MAG: hypothetical protein AAFW01_00220 [Pseudomonadota bacterium]